MESKINFYTRIHGEAYGAELKELISRGMDFEYAINVLNLRGRINSFPNMCGDNYFIAIIFGDFMPLSEELSVESLGITISPERSDHHYFESYISAHNATVSIKDRSLESIQDAVGRMNMLVGASTLVTWGQRYCNWWSPITHETSNRRGGSSGLSHEDMENVINHANSLTGKIRKKVLSALYWYREPDNSLMSHKQEVLRTYAAFWNVFECLVDAINIHDPVIKMTRPEKVKEINKLYEENGKELTLDFINKAKKIVEPGIKRKAMHALNLCFKDDADYYIYESFEREDLENRLYNVRNQINHGEVDPENQIELARIQSRLKVLWFMIQGVFQYFLPYTAMRSNEIKEFNEKRGS